MTKRFELRLCSNGSYYVYENGTLTDIDFDKFNKENAYALIDKVNALYDENQKLKEANQDLQYKIGEVTNLLHKEIKTSKNAFYGLMQENKELRQKIAQLKNK